MDKEQPEVYFDHAGTVIPSKQMLSNIFNDMSTFHIGNPHSSVKSQSKIDDCRKLVLDHFKVDSSEYDIVFTSGTTAAMKLVGETLEWGEHGCLAYPMNVHTSVLGMRCLASQTICFSQHACQYLSNIPIARCRTIDQTNEEEGCGINLLVIPGECNFSGAKSNLLFAHDVELHHRRGIQWLSQLAGSAIVHGSAAVLPAISSLEGGIVVSNDTASSFNNHDSDNISIHDSNSHSWLWMLDAAKLCAGSVVDLSALPVPSRPHFVALSFYKLFGYPTGLGALLVRKDVQHLFSKIDRPGCIYQRKHKKTHQSQQQGGASSLSPVLLCNTMR